MALKATRNAGKAPTGINEAALNKGELRKLTALRKSLGANIAERAFSQWMKQKAKAEPAAARDRNAELITDTLGQLIKGGGLRIPRGGYVVTRGRGRVIVTRAKG